MNTPDLVGAAGYVTEARRNIFLPDRLWQIVFSEVDARFIHLWTLTHFYRDQVRAVCAGTSASMQNLSQDDFKSFIVAVPELEEQKEIVAFLERETGKLESLTATAGTAITLLQERRASLISAAVTGKIDVRDIVSETTEAA